MLAVGPALLLVGPSPCKPLFFFSFIFLFFYKNLDIAKFAKIIEKS